MWGGEYQFDNWHIRLLKQRGKSANAIIAYGRNLISFEQDTNIADTYTSVYPYYQENSGDEGNKNHFLPERTVDSEFVGKYPNPKVLMLDLSNKFKDVADYSETKLRNYALSYIQSNNIGVPKVNMKISTVDLSRATGGFSEDIDLGDTVNVYFEKLGITTSAKVIKAVWNVLSDDYDKFEIGARRSSLTESISELATTADENANKALNQALVALQSADGKSTIYYLNSSDPWPTNPNENDTAFVKDGENSIMYRYMFNNDTGVFSWVKILDSMSADQIKQRVSDALESGKAYSDQLVADNVAQVNAVLDDVQAKQADLTAQQAELDTKAQGYANKALADAKADTLATATQTAKDAQDALDSAKTTLTTSLNKEVTDRTNAVSALDTKAQGYADTAKTDAINAATTADGVINKKIDDTASSITSTISQNKVDADGKITTAQSTATQALNGLATKVSQTVYDTKTGQLQTDLNTTTATANQAKTDIVAIKKTNTDQDTRMTTIESDANGVKTTVSSLQTTQNTQAGSISTLQQRADGFDATVTKVNSLGQINQIVNSEFAPDMSGWYGQGLQTEMLPYGLTAPANGSNVYAPSTVPFSRLQSAPVAVTPGMVVSYSMVKKGTYWSYLNASDAKGNIINVPGTSSNEIAGSNKNNSGYTKAENITIPAGVNYVSLGVWNSGFTAISQPMLVFSATVGTYVAGNYNNNASVAKAQLTADQAITSLNNYKTDADGRISKAQADIVVNANAITQKVSQSDYNAKTGDLTTKVNTAQSTADSATSTIGSYKTANDARVASAESKITANASAITSKVSQTAYDAKTGELSGQISAINQRADEITQSVASVQTKVNSMGQINQLFNTEFSPDFSGWYGRGLYRNGIKGALGTARNGSNVFQKITGGPTRLQSEPVPVVPGMIVSYSVNKHTDFGTWSYLNAADANGNIVNVPGTTSNEIAGSATQSVKAENIRIPAGVNFISFGVLLETSMPNGDVLSQPMLVYSSTIGNYVPGSYNNNNKVAAQQITLDSITNVVSDPATGLTKRVQTAEGSISTVQSNVSDLQSKQTQTASGLTTEISNRATGTPTP